MVPQQLTMVGLKGREIEPESPPSRCGGWVMGDPLFPVVIPTCAPYQPKIS
jgi:hypothetical protein